tara:strand:+ start:1700 stop:2251 length:552 start_codon:yes stop_codon:yes gene_type:complete
MYSRPNRNWGIIVLVSILGISNISLMNSLVSHRFKTPYPNVNIPVGPYTSYDLTAGKNGYRLSYRANDPKVLKRYKNLEEPKGLLGEKKRILNLEETYTMKGESSNNDVEGTVMTEKDLACLKVEGSGNSTGKIVGASVGVKAAPAFSGIPIVGWLAAGFVTMFSQDKGSEIGGQIARDFNDC